GFIIFLFPKIVKQLKRRGKNTTAYIKTLRPSYRWHNKLGWWLAAFIFILFLSGTFLRPPLLIAIIRGKVSPLPFSTLDSNNAWNDRLRCLNYDTLRNEWLLYSSEGFFTLTTLQATPIRIQNAPRVSVMGVNVMKQVHESCWIVGSFDGLVMWDKTSGACIDYITKRPIMPRKAGPPIESAAITGYSNDFIAGDIAFGYSGGAKYIHSNKPFIDMNKVETPEKISLWHLALEVHTGRIYQPIIGILSDLYVFISGILLVIITITGLLLYRRRRRRRKRKS
ncbi:MAG: PepSY domain-containing protein, partial [Phocaeicola sp.]